MADVVAAWPDAVGAAIARNAWPARLSREGVLHVNASSSAWAFELGQLAQDLVGRLREELGESAPKALRFSPGPLPEAVSDRAPSERSDPAREPSPEERELASALTVGIADEELRGLVARAAAASLSRQRNDRSVW
jgi:hypothetical protein